MSQRAVLSRAARPAVSLAAALLVAVLAAAPARGHIVATGVGTQTWLAVTPRRLVARFNLGFSSLLGIGELKRADRNKDGDISVAEVEPYLADLEPRVLPFLRLHLDGKPLAWRVVSHEAVGLRGQIANVAFDTFFNLEADLPADGLPHDLQYFEGTFQNETSQQLLYVATHPLDFKEFQVEQEAPGPTVEQPGVRGDTVQLGGRDVKIHYQWRPAALERDRADALIEPTFRGLDAALEALARVAAKDAERSVTGLAHGAVAFVPRKGAFGLGGAGGFSGAPSAPTAQERGPGPNPPAMRAAVGDEQRMQGLASQPFAWSALLTFALWGALHAKAPGHGKVMVASYLIGTQGRVWDAVRLGAIVTFTHTFTLYTFGLGLVFLVERLKLSTSSQALVHQRATFFLTVGSGIGLCLYGLALARSRYASYKRSAAPPVTAAPLPASLPETLAAPAAGRRLGLLAVAPAEAPAPAAPTHGDGHTHSHDGHTHSHDGHTPTHGDGHTHSHDGHTHSHDGHTHSHEGMDEDEHAALHAREVAAPVTTFKDLLSLGLSGGIVPCPAGVTLIVYSSTLREDVTFNTFVYLNAFSVGLGSVLVGIALAMVLSRRYLMGAISAKRQRLLSAVPIASAFFVALVGFAIAYSGFDPEYKNAWAKLSRIVSSESVSKP